RARQGAAEVHREPDREGRAHRRRHDGPRHPRARQGHRRHPDHLQLRLRRVLDRRHAQPPARPRGAHGQGLHRRPEAQRLPLAAPHRAGAGVPLHPYRTGPGGAAAAHDRDGLLGQHRAQAVLQVPQEPARSAARRAGRRRPCGCRARRAHGAAAGRDPPAPPELADLPGPRLLTARPVACSDRGHSTAHNGDMAHSTRSRRVLITGATGGVGSHLASTLAEEYELVLHGRSPEETTDGVDMEIAELSDNRQVRAPMDGDDTADDRAAAAPAESSWDLVLEANLIGVRNVLEAAREAGVRRVVLASSNHAMGMYDRYEEWPVYPDQLPRADSLYGVSKIFGEAIGRFYHDEHGLDVINLRIGWFAEDPLAAE